VTREEIAEDFLGRGLVQIVDGRCPASAAARLRASESAAAARRQPLRHHRLELVVDEIDARRLPDVKSSIAASAMSTRSANVIFWKMPTAS
jgi:hypothetical protein